MDFLLNPNVAYLLIVSGFVLAILALFSPGTGLLEAGAFILLLLGGFSTYNLEVNAWALAILLLGVFPFLLALRRTRQWIFLVISLLALVVGSVFLFRSTGNQPSVHPLLATLVASLSTALLWFVAKKGLEAMEQVPAHDLSHLIGEIGEAQTDIKKEGSVYVGGEDWTAYSDALILAGSRVKVIDRDGLVLHVEEVHKDPPAAGLLS
ncbi:MAG: hypothetical protein GYA17_04185 [Chloroflexi bacterium]|nr:NfeD family protein [Anaerolineaceae bacterium]NMB87535.1 hypothetical protein [Chloroflexota bacterium]